MGSKHRMALLLNHEIASVITAMRYNSRWAVVPKYYEEDRNEPSKHDDAFRNLRSEIFRYQDWADVDPMLYLAPFLSLIKASDVSGPITGAAAVALQRILHSGLLTPTTKNAEAAINQIVEDATQCKFESTNNAQDEIVLLNVVQVLGQAVECDAGVLLSDETICKAIRAAFLLGDPVTKPKEYGDIMNYYSRQACGTMIRTVFRRLREQALHEMEGAKTAHKASVQCRHGIKAAVEIMDFLIELIKKDPSLGREQIEETIIFSLDMIHAGLLAVGHDLVHFEVLVAQIHIELLHAMCQAVVEFTTVPVINGFCQMLLVIYKFLGTISIGQIETVLERVLLKLADGKGVSSLEQQEAALEGILDLCRQPGFIHDIFVNCDCRLERANLFEDICALISKTAFPVAKGSLGPLHFISLEALLAVLHAIAAENKANAFQLAPAELELPFFIDVWGPLVHGEHPNIQPLMDAADTAAAAAMSSLAAAEDHAASAANVGSRGGHASTIEGIENAADHAAAEQGHSRADGLASASGSSLPGGMGAAAGNGSSSRQPGSSLASSSGHSGLPPHWMGGSSTGAGPNSSKDSTADASRLRSAVYEKHIKVKVGLAVDHFNKDHKKGFQFLQATKLMPVLAANGTEPGIGDAASEADLASCLGHFLHVCPGLNKVAIGELLGEPDAFYLKVLDAYTASFDFHDLKFDAAIRLFLESFRLPGEAQKIDRIINSFGRHFYRQNSSIFKSSDAAYVLAYSVIMLNTDRHSSQVKNKMTLESFRRNLRGVNESSDFPEDFLNDIFYGIVKTALRMSESSSMDVSEQSFIELHQLSRTPRGQMVHSDPGRHLFDTTMFRLIWGPAVHAMCSIIDNVNNETLVEAALNGLQVASYIAASHQLEDVADSIVVNLSKIPQQIAHVAGSRPEFVFGRDAKMRAVTLTIASIANKHGDCLQSGWTNVMDTIICFYRQSLLPDSFCKALNGDGEGGLVVRDGEATSLKARRALAKANNAAGTSIFKSISSFTSILALPSVEPEYPERQNSENEKQLAAAAEEVLARCSFEDIFTDSKFLKQESLVHLVKAIIWASGPIPRPGGSSSSWDVSELCLELLFTVLLRNRDRIGLLWPKTYEHFQKIFSHSKEVEPTLVQKAIMAMMRLCQRLLPYKADISEPLMKGIQLVSSVDEQVASDMAAVIATEVLNLLKGAAPYIQHQPVWVSICGLIKIIQYDPASFPVCVETLSWVVKESLTPLNFTIVLQTVVDLLERAIPDTKKGERQGHPTSIPALLSLMMSSEEWLELWWATTLRNSPMPEPGWVPFKNDAWYHVVSMLCRIIKNSNLEVRSSAVSYLQRSVVAAEKLSVSSEHVQQSLLNLILPMTHDLSKLISHREFLQADVTIRELVRAVVKVVLLYAEQLQRLPTFSSIWRSILECLGAAMSGAARSEVLAEAIPEALKNMLLVLHTKGNLTPGWRDADGTDLWELTWRVARKISPNLTPQLLGS